MGDQGLTILFHTYAVPGTVRTVCFPSPQWHQGAGSIASVHNIKNANKTPGLLHVTAQRAVRGHQDVQAQVKLPSANQ